MQRRFVPSNFWSNGILCFPFQITNTVVNLPDIKNIKTEFSIHENNSNYFNNSDRLCTKKKDSDIIMISQENY